jgi:hypothetical protein
MIRRILPLAGFKAGIAFVDHEKAATAANDAAIFVAQFC